MKLSMEEGRALIAQLRTADPNRSIIVRVDSEETAMAALEAGADYVICISARDEPATTPPPAIPTPRP